MHDEELLLLLARVALPTLPSHSLEALAEHYGIGEPSKDKLAEVVFLRLVEEMEALPPAVIDEANWLLAQLDTPLREVFAEVEKEKTKRGFGAGGLKLEGLLPDFSGVLGRRPKGEEAEFAPVDAAELSGFFRAGGRIAKVLPEYEERPPQLKMLEEVTLALNEGHHLMVEAGTGTGKSLAYLLPCIEWALKNKTPVIVSTNTKNLQSQLWEQDIPSLAKALGKPFQAALIKGRGNYLCVRKFLYTLRQAPRELSEEERIALLSILTWLAQTRTGDIAENTGFAGFGLPRMWEHLCSMGPDCPGRKCGNYRNCFLMKARARSLSAQIVVANHAVVFSELASPTTAVLPKYYHIVLDEAQNLEDAATEHLGVSIERWRLFRPLRRLFRRDRSGAGTGLVPSILAQLSRAKDLPEGTADGLRRLANQVLEFVPPVEAASSSFLASLEGVLAARKGSEDRLRYDEPALAGEAWQEAAAEKASLVSRMGSLISAMERLHDALEGPAMDSIEFGAELVMELGLQCEILREITGDLEFLLRATDKDFVYWAERLSGEQPEFRLAAAPIDISRLMYARVHEPNRSVIMCSATLTVGGRFDYLKERLGLALLPEGRLRTLDAGTTFDYPNQCLVLVPTFLPEPRDEAGAFVRQLSDFLARLCASVPGGKLLLFTSYEMLNAVHSALSGQLPKRIPLLAQGISGTREQITHLFRKEKKAVLLGTHSFWEGIDIPGEALSCLILAKLPFQVHTDPVVEARCELLMSAGQDAFLSYSLPNAVIRFRQGFGRLIRRRDDRGVFICCDKRVVTKRYGAAFLRSLPTGYRVVAREEELIETAAGFLEGKRNAAPVRDKKALLELLSKRSASAEASELAKRTRRGSK